MHVYIYIYIYVTSKPIARDVGGWGGDPKKKGICTNINTEQLSKEFSTFWDMVPKRTRKTLGGKKKPDEKH